MVDFNETLLHVAILNLDKHAWIFSRLSIASADDKQHLSEVQFIALVGFSLLEKYPTFGAETKQSYQESQKSQGAESTQFLVLIPITSRSIPILSSHLRLGLPKDFFPVGLPVKILEAFYPPPFWLRTLLISIF